MTVNNEHFTFGQVLIREHRGNTWRWWISPPGTLASDQGSIDCSKNGYLCAGEAFWSMDQKELDRRYKTKLKKGYIRE